MSHLSLSLCGGSSKRLYGLVKEKPKTMRDRTSQALLAESAMGGGKLFMAWGLSGDMAQGLLLKRKGMRKKELLGKGTFERGHTCLSNVNITQQFCGLENSEGP
jgi:hypothetical protein